MGGLLAIEGLLIGGIVDIAIMSIIDNKYKHEGEQIARSLFVAPGSDVKRS